MKDNPVVVIENWMISKVLTDYNLNGFSIYICEIMIQIDIVEIEKENINFQNG
jgi:hypothetical protein